VVSQLAALPGDRGLAGWTDFVYVRKAQKATGTRQRLEGPNTLTARTPASDPLRAIWVDDCLSTGTAPWVRPCSRTTVLKPDRPRFGPGAGWGGRVVVGHDGGGAAGCLQHCGGGGRLPCGPLSRPRHGAAAVRAREKHVRQADSARSHRRPRGPRPCSCRGQSTFAPCTTSTTSTCSFRRRCASVAARREAGACAMGRSVHYHRVCAPSPSRSQKVARSVAAV
jgi:hypothetical protein